MDDRELAGRLTTIENKIDEIFKQLMFLSVSLEEGEGEEENKEVEAVEREEEQDDEEVERSTLTKSEENQEVKKAKHTIKPKDIKEY